MKLPKRALRRKGKDILAMDLIRKLGYRQQDATEIVKLFFDVLAQALADGRKIDTPLGTLLVSEWSTQKRRVILGHICLHPKYKKSVRLNQPISLFPKENDVEERRHVRKPLRGTSQSKQS